MTGPRSYIPALDGLRGLAAMWVFLLHLTDVGAPQWTVGYLGVDLFFVLSGFVLAHVYASSLTGGAAYLRFLKARFARIYPLYLTTLLATLAVVLLWPGFTDSYPQPERRFGADSFLASLLLVQNWAYFMPSSWNAPAWSLSAEWAAYLVFPVLLAVSRRVPWPFALALGSMVALAVLLAAWGAPPGATGTPGMLRAGCGALAGCLVHRAYAEGCRLPPGPATACALLLLAVAHVPGLASAGTLAFPILVLLCARGEGPAAALCATRPVVWLGTISYSIYLWHWLAIQVAARVPGVVPSEIGWGTMIVALVLLWSWASYRWLEKPARAWLIQARFWRPQPVRP